MGEVKAGNGVLTVEQKLDLVIELVTVRGHKNILQNEMDAVLDAGDAERFREIAVKLERVALVERELTNVIDRA